MSENYLDVFAQGIRALVPPGDLPEENTTSLFRLYAVLALAKGSGVSAEDVHNAWVAWMADREPTHESLVPFDELSPGVADADIPFLKAIRSASRF